MLKVLLGYRIDSSYVIFGKTKPPIMDVLIVEYYSFFLAVDSSSL
jgi:hypothetical protein